jgi:CcmD family protein
MEGNLSYLFAGYTAIWIALFTYLMRLRRRGRDLRQELDLLRDKVGEDRDISAD